MDRPEFSKMLVRARLGAKKSVPDMMFELRWLANAIYRMEKAQNAYRMDRCLLYLQALSSGIELIPIEGERFCIHDYTGIHELFMDYRSTRTNEHVANMLGCDVTYIHKLTTGKSVMSIDIFLKLIGALYYEPKIAFYNYG